MRIIRETWVNKCRRPHICWYCGHRIEIGEKAYLQVNLEDDLQSVYSHEICNEHVNQFGELDNENMYCPHETGNLEQIRKEVENGI